MTLDEQIEEIERKIRESNNHWDKRDLLEKLERLWIAKHRKTKI